MILIDGYFSSYIMVLQKSQLSMRPISVFLTWYAFSSAAESRWEKGTHFEESFGFGVEGLLGVLFRVEELFARRKEIGSITGLSMAWNLTRDLVYSFFWIYGLFVTSVVRVEVRQDLALHLVDVGYVFEEHDLWKVILVLTLK